MDDLPPNPTIVEYSAATTASEAVECTKQPREAVSGWQGPNAMRAARQGPTRGMGPPARVARRPSRDATGRAQSREKTGRQGPARQAPARDAKGKGKGSMRSTEPAQRRAGSGSLRPNACATSNAARTLIGEPEAAPTKNYGKVPAYINKRKQELADVKQAEHEERTRERVPEGLRRVGPAEQAETLMVLAERIDAAERAFASLPLSCKTQRQRVHKENLEQKIDAHNKLIQAYSKPKVFVGVDVAPIARDEDEDDDQDVRPFVTPAFDRASSVMGGMGSIAGPSHHTGVKVAQPPGGYSSFKFG